MTLTAPLVSIICDTYNHRSFIRQCIDGFLGQKTDFPFEILIHDDASTDETTEIIREYEKKHPEIIKAIYQDLNQYSRGDKIWTRFQFPRAMGKYIALCEGDDYWTDPLKLQKQVSLLESNKNLSACFTNAEIINEIDNTRKVFLDGLSEGIVPRERLVQRGGAFYPTASILFPKDCFDLNAFQKIHELAGDTLLIITLAMKGDVYFLNEKTCVYRIWHGGVYSSMRDDIEKRVSLKKKTVAGLKRLYGMSERSFRKLLKDRISKESLFVLRNDNPFRNLARIFDLKPKDFLRLVFK